MNAKTSKRIRKMIRATGIDPKQSQHVIGKPILYSVLDGIQLTGKVRAFYPIKLDAKCGRAMYKALKKLEIAHAKK